MSNLTSSSNLSGLMQTFYDRKFLEFARGEYPLWQFGQKRDLPANNGKNITFNRYTLLPAATTALTEAQNPSGTDLSTSTVTATIAEYGDFTKTSSLMAMTAIDPELSEKVDLFKEHACLTFYTIIRNSLLANTTDINFTGGKTAIGDLTASDVLATTDIQLAVRDLKANKAKKIDGYWICVIGSNTEYDFTKDPNWVQAQQYAGSSNLFSGEIGKWFNVRFVYTSEAYVEASGNNGANVYSNFIFGDHAYGVVDFAKAAASGSANRPQIIVKNPGPQDTSNPLNRFSTAGWQITFGQQVLNTAWIINIKSGATA